MATIPASENEFPEVLLTEGAAPAAPGANLVKIYAKSDGLVYSKDDANTETALGPGTAATDHIADTTDAHDASAVSFDPTGLSVVTGTEVQTAIEELDAGIAGGGIPATIVNAKGDIIAATADDTVARLAVGANGFALTAASGETTGLRWATPTVPSARASRSSGNITLNSTSWANVDTGLDLTLPVAAGDVIEVSFSCVFGSELIGAYLDAATIVSGSPVNYISGGAGGASSQGVTGWRGGGNVAENHSGGTAVQYVIQSGDISSGNVVLRLRYRTSAASNKTLFASADIRLHWCAKNLGA